MSHNRLPAPTTLGNHIIAPRSDRSSTSRGSHTSSSSSRHSSVSRPIATTVSGSALDLEMDLDADADADGEEDEGFSEEVYDAGSNSLASTSTPLSDPQPTPSSATLPLNIIGDCRPAPNRRRAFTIHDEVQHAHEGNLSVVTGPSRSGGMSSVSSLTPVTTSADEINGSKEPRRKRQKKNPPKKEESSETETESDSGVEIICLPGELELGAPTTRAPASRTAQQNASPPATPVKSEAIADVSHESVSEFTCPICFSAPTNATATLCGHVMCGQCLFAAVKSQLGHGAFGHDRNVARCPVCREELKGWDGVGGGVIGLKMLTINE